MEQLFPIFGFALILAALLQFGLWTGHGLRLRRLEKKKFQLELEKLRAEIYQIKQGDVRGENTTLTEQTPSIPQLTNEPLAVGDWRGFRTFTVAQIVSETANCSSIYLKPADGKPIVGFQPGQHLTLKFPVPGQPSPPVRCYSLSDAFNESWYRISVKKCPPAANQPNAPKGLVSHFINEQLNVGDALEVKSPSGKFYLQPGNEAVVLLAGGIGITPMLGMLNYIAQTSQQRECLLVYGVRNSTDHAFKDHLSMLASRHDNIHIATCYTNPLPEDRLNDDFHVKGFVSVNILKQILPHNAFDFYLCGPPPFMDSLSRDLAEWGVEKSRVRSEAFGPASIQKKKPTTPGPISINAAIPVKLRNSEKVLSWNHEHENLLDLMEANDIPVDSGCRAGSCGTCQTRLLGGKVSYDDPEAIDCETGFCLPCVAVPTEAIELDV